MTDRILGITLVLALALGTDGSEDRRDRQHHDRQDHPDGRDGVRRNFAGAEVAGRNAERERAHVGERAEPHPETHTHAGGCQAQAVRPDDEQAEHEDRRECECG